MAMNLQQSFLIQKYPRLDVWRSGKTESIGEKKIPFFQFFQQKNLSMEKKSLQNIFCMTEMLFKARYYSKYVA